MKILKHRTFWVLLLFGFLFSSISIVNHYLFRTFTLDLGLYTQALFDYRQFQWSDTTVFQNPGGNILGDHLDFYLILFAPFSFIFGSYTLLILQVVFLLLGSIGVYKFVTFATAKKTIALFAQIHFLTFFGVYGALEFDYHSNVIATCLLPWLLLAVWKNQFAKAGVLALLMCMGKETISLWLIFIALGLMIEFRKSKPHFKFTCTLMIFGCSYFLFATSYLLPRFNWNGQYEHFDYSAIAPTA